ncbi:MAG: MBOAT family protein [Myxacorys chilensis ATA2-1-KO14]|jgi:D-alanyl-lipoteichoic acid acyltransferase DltB (MBOAT superfamily)|nr:MBOAT family protein [Myxacorys chilensis ATA2-1-KO14]
MTFTTLTFILLLAIAFTTYWSIKQRSYQNIFLIIVSYIFYGWWDYRFCFLLFFSSLVDYVAGYYLARLEDPKWRRLLLGLSLIFNLGILGFFKYWNFFADSLSRALGSVGWQVDAFSLNVILPLGISFYTFQTLTYTIDIYRRQLQPARNLINYLCYLSFFPQLVAGPIERASHLLPQVERDRQFNYARSVDGCQQMLWGFFKKMAIADNLAPIVERAYASPGGMSGPQLAFATVLFAFQIYCDFSAYSDIAIGTARLFGFDLMQNFAYPYFSQSISEFWRRWHISLSTWLKDYVYIPLGGSRVAPIRRSLNVMITFLLSGLWHGASLNFVIWGGIHGALIILEPLWGAKSALKATDIPGGERRLPNFSTVFRIVLTFTLTCFAWIFFRAQSGQTAALIIRKILTEPFQLAAYQSFGTIFSTSPLEPQILITLLIGFIAAEWMQRHKTYPLQIEKWHAPLRWLVYTALFWITLFWGTWNTGEFVYFQF